MRRASCGFFSEKDLPPFDASLGGTDSPPQPPLPSSSSSSSLSSSSTSAVSDGCFPAGGGYYPADVAEGTAVAGMFGSPGECIVITSFALQGTSSCWADWLVINDVKYCGRSDWTLERMPPLDTPIVLNSAPTFRSDYVEQYSGFCWTGPSNCPGAAAGGALPPARREGGGRAAAIRNTTHALAHTRR